MSMTIVLEITEFDILAPEWSTNYIFEYEEFPDESFQSKMLEIFHVQMQDIGYDTHNSIPLLGSVFIFTVLYFLIAFVLLSWMLVVKMFALVTGYGDEFIRYLQGMIRFRVILVIGLESYIPMLISGYANYNLNLDSTLGEKIGYYTSVYCLLFAIIIIHVTLIYVFT